MIYKFLHITDIHFNPLHRIPQSRTDDFHAHIRAKWDILTHIIKREEILGGFISGDIFHLKNPNYYFPEYITYYSDMFEQTEIPWKAIPGNHDLPKSAYVNIEKSPYNLLCRATSNLEDVSLKTIKFDCGGTNIYVSGLPFYQLKDTLAQFPNVNDYLGHFKDGFNILLLHADALPDGSIELFWDTVGYDYILSNLPNADLICLGHIHASFPVHKVVNATTNKPQLISKPWSFSRVAKDYFNKTEILEIQHKPSYSIIAFDIEPGEKFNVDVSYHEIPHEPFDKVFKKDSILKVVETSDKLADFIEMIKKERGEGKLQFDDPEQYLRNSEAIGDDVKELILEYLGES